MSGSLSSFVDRKPEQSAAESFYQAHNYQPIWTGSPEALKRAEGAIAFLRNLKSEGLEPRDYPTPDLANLTEEQAAKAELQLTGSVLRYARHASSGRVSYTRVSASILYPDHAADPAEVLSKVASAQDMKGSCRVSSRNSRNSWHSKPRLRKSLPHPSSRSVRFRIARSSKKHRGKETDERSRRIPPTRSSPIWSAGAGCRATSAKPM